MDSLEKIYEEMLEAARGFKKSEADIVYGEGRRDAAIMLVGEAPGAEETRLSRPFVGQAGKNLDEFLLFLGLQRGDIYITNTVKFRPYKISPKGRVSNRPPKQAEIDLMVPFLLREIEAVSPKIVVTLGNVPLKCVLQDKKASIGGRHARPAKARAFSHEFILFPLYHPASVIYDRSLKERYNGDLLLLKDFLDGMVWGNICR